MVINTLGLTSFSNDEITSYFYFQNALFLENYLSRNLSKIVSQDFLSNVLFKSNISSKCPILGKGGMNYATRNT